MDASYKIQRGIHVHLIQFFMCPEFWVHIKSILCFSFCQRAARLSYFFALFSEKSRILRAVGRVGSVLVAEKKKRSKHRKCSHTSENRPAPVPAGRGRLLVGESPKPLFRKDGE